MLIVSARPWVAPRIAVRPGRRAVASPVEASGSLPISSALTDSTIWSDFFFLLIAFCSEARKPVTVMVLLGWSACGVGLAPWSVVAGCAAVAADAAPVTPGCCCARAGLETSTAAIANGLAAATRREREEMLIIIFPLRAGANAGQNLSGA